MSNEVKDLSVNMSQVIEILADYGLGLEDSSVGLSDHNPKWRRAYSKLAYEIIDALRLDDIRLYHVGSTSISGTKAKPIIDILGSISALSLFDSRQTALENMGFEIKGEYGISGRRYCVLSDKSTGRTFAHIHVFEHQSDQISSHLLFRNYLRSSSVDRDSYTHFKEQLILNGTLRSQFSAAKNVIIGELMMKAKVWDQSRSKKSLAISSSAAGGGNTIGFAREYFDGQGINPDIIELSNAKLEPYTYDNVAQPDDHLGVLQKMLHYDDIYFIAPVYWYAMPGPLKIFFDRLSDYLNGSNKSLADQLYGKRVYLLSTGSDSRLPLGFETPFASTCVYFGLDYMGSHYKQVI